MYTRAPPGATIRSIVDKWVLLVSKPQDNLPVKVGRVALGDPEADTTTGLRVKDDTGELHAASTWHSGQKAWKDPSFVIDWHGDYRRTFMDGALQMMICNVPNTMRDMYIAAPSSLLGNPNLSEANVEFTELTPEYVKTLRGRATTGVPPGGADITSVPADTHQNDYSHDLDAIKSRFADAGATDMVTTIEDAASCIADINQSSDDPVAHMGVMAESVSKLHGMCKTLIEHTEPPEGNEEEWGRQQVKVEGQITNLQGQISSLQEELTSNKHALENIKKNIEKSRIHDSAKDAVDIIQAAVTPNGKRKREMPAAV